MTKLNVRALSAGLVTAVALFSCVSTALADDVQSNTVRLGLYSVFYHTSADDISGPYVPPGVNLKEDNLDTLYIAYIRRLTSHFDVELTAGYPPLSKTVGVGPAALGSAPYNGQVISTARWLAPTLLLEYRFMDEASPWQPYIGAGVNHTSFYDRNSTAAGDAATGGPTKLSLTSSTGPAGTVGFVYKFAQNWSFDASYSIARVKTHLTADTAGVIRTTDISFGPQALVLAVGYSF
jgi:outer membrane protein